MNVRPKVQEDGSLLFNKVDMLPPDQEGYTRDPTDPYHFFPKWPICNHRQEGFYTRRCCGGGTVKFFICGKGFPPTLQECRKCELIGRNK